MDESSASASNVDDSGAAIPIVSGVGISPVTGDVDHSGSGVISPRGGIIRRYGDSRRRIIDRRVVNHGSLINDRRLINNRDRVSDGLGGATS